MNDAKTCQHTTELLSGYLDGELTQQQSQLVTAHIQQCQACGSSYRELQQLQSTVQQAHYPGMEEQAIQKLLSDPASTTLQTISWLAIVTSLTIAVVFVVYQFLLDSIMPWYEKLFVSLFWGGGIGLFLCVLRQRLIARKTDKYRKVNL